jgi:hypothetical protein
MSFEPLDDVRDVVAEVAYLVHASAGVDASAFLADATLQRAFLRVRLSNLASPAQRSIIRWAPSP